MLVTVGDMWRLITWMVMRFSSSFLFFCFTMTVYARVILQLAPLKHEDWKEVKSGTKERFEHFKHFLSEIISKDFSHVLPAHASGRASTRCYDGSCRYCHCVLAPARQKCHAFAY